MRRAFATGLLVLAACADERALPGPLPEPIGALAGTAHPAAQATNVALDAEVRVHFSGPIAAVSALGGLVLTRPGPTGGPRRVQGSTFVEDGHVLVFVPETALAPSTRYTAEVTNAVRDHLGRPLREGEPFRWSFETGLAAGAKRVSPALVAVAPVEGAEAISIHVRPVLSFSHVMDGGSLDAAVRLETAAGAPVVRTLEPVAGGRAVTVVPAAPLSVSSTYVLRVTTEAKSADGQALAAERRWAFETSADPTHGAPLTVSSVSPADGARNVVLRTAVKVRFTREISPSTLTDASFRLDAGEGGPVAGSVSWDAATKTAAFTPSARLAVGTTFRATLDGLSSDEGLPLAQPFSWSFTTTTDAELGERPRVLSSTPAADAVEVAREAAIRIVFSKPVDTSSVTGESATVSARNAPVAVQRAFEESGRALVLRPEEPLPYDTTVRVELTSAVLDGEGLALEPFQLSFRTLPDRIAPAVIATSPAADATEVPLNAAVKVTFSEPIDGPSARLALSTTSGAIAGAVSYDAASKALSFMFEGFYLV